MSTAQIAMPCPSTTAMDLLSKGVPLSLLLDLVFGPHSEDLLAAERRIPAPRPAS